MAKSGGELSDLDKANVGELLFGSEQSDIGYAILDNYERVEHILQTAQNSTGRRKVKEVTCYSYEYVLNYRQIGPLSGTFQFHDPTGTNKNTITSIIRECAPDRKFDVVPSKISSRYRTLDVSSQSVYSFLMNDCQSVYGAIFTFDTVNKVIHVQDLGAEVDTVNIFLSGENLLINQSIEELSDEIVTCLGVYGADDVDIRPVNPLASPKIYNPDYFIQVGDIAEDVAEAWKTRKFSFVYCLRVGSLVILFGAVAIITGDFDTAAWMAESLKFCKFVIGTGTAVILTPNLSEFIQFVKEKISGE